MDYLTDCNAQNKIPEQLQCSGEHLKCWGRRYLWHRFRILGLLRDFGRFPRKLVYSYVVWLASVYRKEVTIDKCAIVCNFDSRLLKFNELKLQQFLLLILQTLS